MVGIVGEHQRLFSCRSPDRHAALLKDLKKRRISAGLLLVVGELSGRTDAKVAENQGQGESWATELTFLGEVKEKDFAECRKAVEDLLTGAIVGGTSMWFGVPWARSAAAGVVSAFVAGTARVSNES